MRWTLVFGPLQFALLLPSGCVTHIRDAGFERETRTLALRGRCASQADFGAAAKERCPGTPVLLRSFTDPIDDDWMRYVTDRAET